MGQAFHRKRMFISSGHTRGTGIHYIEPPRVAPRTGNLAPTKEEMAQREAVLAEQRRLRQDTINIINAFAVKMLTAWIDGCDDADVHLENFPGWTKSIYCELPVDADCARLYAEVIHSTSMSSLARTTN